MAAGDGTCARAGGDLADDVYRDRRDAAADGNLFSIVYAS